MSKYLHEYNEGKCRKCGFIAIFEKDDAGNILCDKEGKPIKKADLMICTGCKSAQYCCKECQVEDWPNHKKFCKRFRKLIAEYKVTRDTRPRGAPKPKKPTPYPLHDFIEEGDWPGLKQYITENPGCNPNGTDSPQFMSPLLLACGQGQIECVHILMRAGADITAECSSINLTPLQYASWWGHDDIVQLLLNHGVDVNQTNADGTFALGYATGKLQPDVVKLLLRHGADPNQRNLLGWTPLIQVCLGATIQDDNPDEDKRSVLQRKMEDNPKIIRIAKMLLEAGADINARNHSQWGVSDFRGDTALNMCTDDDKVDVMEFLISEGALLDIQCECECCIIN